MLSLQNPSVVTPEARESRSVWSSDESIPRLARLWQFVKAPLWQLGPSGRWLPIAAMYIVCCAVWIKFFDFGRINFAARDWMQERAYFLTLATALKHGILPLHMATPIHGTQRFLAIPESNLAPHIVLLRWYSIEKVILVNAIVSFTMGYVGCIAFARKYGLSLLAFSTLVLLFNFNGHIVSHLAAGHNWYGYFAFPIFFLGLIGVTERAAKAPFFMAAALGVMAILGSFHLFAMCTLMLVIMAMFRKRYWKDYILPVLLGGAIAAGRFLPAGISLHNMDFGGGFPTILDVLDALISSRGPTYESFKITTCSWPWWEYDTFISLVGLGFILNFTCSTERFRARTKIAVYLPCLICLIVLSLNFAYLPVYLSHIPILSSERTTSRFLIMPVAFLIFLASVGFQQWIESGGTSRLVRIASIVMLVEMGGELLWHMSRYTVARSLNVPSDSMIYSACSGKLIQLHDPVYAGALMIGWSVSAAALVILSTRLFRGTAPCRLK